jgi:hypothetical protein
VKGDKADNKTGIFGNGELLCQAFGCRFSDETLALCKAYYERSRDALP